LCQNIGGYHPFQPPYPQNKPLSSLSSPFTHPICTITLVFGQQRRHPHPKRKIPHYQPDPKITPIFSYFAGFRARNDVGWARPALGDRLEWPEMGAFDKRDAYSTDIMATLMQCHNQFGEIKSGVSDSGMISDFY
jgi:hypothetical protein